MFHEVGTLREPPIVNCTSVVKQLDTSPLLKDRVFPDECLDNFVRVNQGEPDTGFVTPFLAFN